MGLAWAIAGWLAFSATAVAASLIWRSLAARAERVARACHEVRGALTAARLGLECDARSLAPSSARVRAIGLELERAAAALDDLQDVDSHTAGGGAPGELVDVAILAQRHG